MLEKIKEFNPSSWAIENKLTVYFKSKHISHYF